MESRPLKYIARACGGELSKGSPDTAVRRVCTDSRQVRAGDLFLALSGERFNGHDYLSEVANKGAAAVVIERQWSSAELGDCGAILVDNTRRALGNLAGTYRGDFSAPVVAVGGSNGKTTTKELISAVLRQKWITLWSEASFNNDIGVPLTLLRLEKDHEAAVLELGTNHPGELQPLVQMCQPSFGVITSIGREHLEFFGDLAGVAEEEGCLAQMLPANGRLLLNGDSEWTQKIASRSNAAVWTCGQSAGCDWRVSGARIQKQGLAFQLAAPEPSLSGEYRLNLLGKHQAINATFAIALGSALGLTHEEIQLGLSECQPPKMRLQLWEQNGVQVLDDAYNANADSMLVALQTLQELPCKGRRVAVLGDMAELGHHSEAAHQEVGRRAAELGVGQLFAVGKMAPLLAQGARDAGLNRVLEFADVSAAADAVQKFVKPGDVLLVKASRATHLEKVAEALRRSEPGRKN